MRSDFAHGYSEAMMKIKEKYMQTNVNEVLTCSCSNSHYQLVFMDIDMPEKNGYQTSIDIYKFLKKNKK